MRGRGTGTLDLPLVVDVSFLIDDNPGPIPGMYVPGPIDRQGTGQGGDEAPIRQR